MQQLMIDALSIVGAAVVLCWIAWIVGTIFESLREYRRKKVKQPDIINRIEEIESKIHELQQSVGGIQDNLDAFSDVPYQINTLATASNVQRKQIEKLSVSVNMLSRRVNRLEIDTTEELEDERATE